MVKRLILFLALALGLFSTAHAVTDSVGISISNNATVRYVTVQSYTAQGIQNAHDSLGTMGGTIYCPAASYNFTVTADRNGVLNPYSKVVIDKPNVTLMGDGDATVFSMVGAGGTDAIAISSDHVTIKNIYFYGTDTSGGGISDGYYAIRSTKPSGGNDYVKILDCTFFGFQAALTTDNHPGDSLTTTGFNNLLFRGNNVTGSGPSSPNYGINLNSSNGARISENLFRNIHTSVSGNFSCPNWVVNSNLFYQNQEGGTDVYYDALNASINSNIFNSSNIVQEIYLDANSNIATVVGNSLNRGTVWVVVGASAKEAHNTNLGTHDI